MAPIKVDLNHAAIEPVIGRNPGHDACIDEIRAAGEKLNDWQQFLDRIAPVQNSKKNKSNKDSLDLQKPKNNLKDNEMFGYTGTFKSIMKDDKPIEDGIKTVTKSKLELEKKLDEQNYAWVD